MKDEFLTSDGIEIEYEYLNNCDVRDKTTSVVFLKVYSCIMKVGKFFQKTFLKTSQCCFTISAVNGVLAVQ